MLVLMNGYNQIGGSNTFLMVFSCCAGMAATLVRGDGVKRASMCAVGIRVSR